MKSKICFLIPLMRSFSPSTPQFLSSTAPHGPESHFSCPMCSASCSSKSCAPNSDQTCFPSSQGNSCLCAKKDVPNSTEESCGHTADNINCNFSCCKKTTSTLCGNGCCDSDQGCGRDPRRGNPYPACCVGRDRTATQQEEEHCCLHGKGQSCLRNEECCLPYNYKPGDASTSDVYLPCRHDTSECSHFKRCPNIDDPQKFSDIVGVECNSLAQRKKRSCCLTAHSPSKHQPCQLSEFQCKHKYQKCDHGIGVLCNTSISGGDRECCLGNVFDPTNPCQQYCKDYNPSISKFYVVIWVCSLVFVSLILLACRKRIYHPVVEAFDVRFKPANEIADFLFSENEDLVLEIERSVLESTLKLAYRYATSGVEGVIRGHTLVLGDFANDTPLPPELGHTSSMNDYAQNNPPHVTNNHGAAVICNHMNADGMTLIDSRTGRAVVNNFLAKSTSTIPGDSIVGGSRCTSTQWLVEQRLCVAIVVREASSDVLLFWHPGSRCPVSLVVREGAGN